jgi:hypothetical protein
VTWDGVIGKGGDAIIDSVCGLKGLSAALIEAGWLTKDDDGVVAFNEWDAHNGENAKKRALDARKTAKYKAKKKLVTENGDQGYQKVTENGDQDKIRIDKSANALSAGARACEDFVTSGENEPAVATPEPDPICVAAAHLCKVYPKRTYLNATIKAAYRDCINDGITPEALLECLRLEQMSKAWEEEDGRYIPKLVVWLQERRFQPLLKQVKVAKPVSKKHIELPEGII